MNTIEVQVCSDGTMETCAVCETGSPYEFHGSSTRTWIVVPTTIELLHICLWCGNTLRQKRLE